MTVFLGIAQLISILFFVIFVLLAVIEGRRGNILAEISHLAWAILVAVGFYGSITLDALGPLIADEPTVIERME